MGKTQFVKEKYVKPHIFDEEENGDTRHDEYGREIPDPKPLEILLNLQGAVKTQDEKLREMLHKELNKMARDNGFETIEESNDFDMDDEDSLALSGYEYVADMMAPSDGYMPPEAPEGPENPEPDPEPVNHEKEPSEGEGDA